MRQTARVLDLQIGRDPHHQPNDSGYIPATLSLLHTKIQKKNENVSSLRCCQTMGTSPNAYFDADKRGYQAEKRKNQAAVEVRVEAEKPAVVHHVGEVAFEIDRVERADGAGANTEERAAEREVDLAIDTGSIARWNGGKGTTRSRR